MAPYADIYAADGAVCMRRRRMTHQRTRRPRTASRISPPMIPPAIGPAMFFLPPPSADWGSPGFGSFADPSVLLLGTPVPMGRPSAPKDACIWPVVVGVAVVLVSVSTAVVVVEKLVVCEVCVWEFGSGRVVEFGF